MAERVVAGRGTGIFFGVQKKQPVPDPPRRPSNASYTPAARTRRTSPKRQRVNAEAEEEAGSDINGSVAEVAWLGVSGTG